MFYTDLEMTDDKYTNESQKKQLALYKERYNLKKVFDKRTKAYKNYLNEINRLNNEICKLEEVNGYVGSNKWIANLSGK